MWWNMDVVEYGRGGRRYSFSTKSRQDKEETTCNFSKWAKFLFDFFFLYHKTYIIIVHFFS